MRSKRLMSVCTGEPEERISSELQDNSQQSFFSKQARQGQFNAQSQVF
jgi:hypothetical protein